MKNSFLLNFSVALSLTLLGGCVSTNTLNLKIESNKLGTTQPPVREAVFLIKETTYAAKATDPKHSYMYAEARASSRMQFYADSLMPQLEARLPAIFQLNGISSRAVRSRESVLTVDDVKNTERIIVIDASRAYTNNLTGTDLMVSVELLDAKNRTPVWRANIAVTGLIFGEISSKAADVFAAKLLEKMRSDKIVGITSGAIRTQ